MSLPVVDVLFARVDEPNADANRERIRERLGFGSRLIEIKNVLGFANVLLAAEADLRRKFFFLVDADARVLDTFRFSVPPEAAQFTCCIYQAVNPINELVYGHGGIKVYDRDAIFSFLHQEQQTAPLSDSLEVLNTLDFPCGGSRHFLRTPANVHEFNSSLPMTWRSAFRETAKQRYLTRLRAFSSQSQEIEDWIEGWMTRGSGRRFGSASMEGAVAGERFGASADQQSILSVNDYAFLAGQFADYCARKQLG